MIGGKEKQWIKRTVDGRMKGTVDGEVEGVTEEGGQRDG